MPPPLNRSHYWYAHVISWLKEFFGYGRSSTYTDARREAEMVGYPGLTAKDDPIFNRCAPRNSGLAADNAVRADVNVVPNLNQVINFSSTSNVGVSKSSAIDARISTNLDIVCDLDCAKLRDLAQSTLWVRNVAKAIRADY